MRFARVPQGGDTCTFCAMLASRGYVYWSASAAGEFNHYHRNCRCLVVPDDGSGEVEGFCFDGISGVVIDSHSLAATCEPVITMDGAIYMRENSRMQKAKGFLGRAFETALSTAVQAAASRI